MINKSLYLAKLTWMKGFLSLSLKMLNKGRGLQINLALNCSSLQEKLTSKNNCSQQACQGTRCCGAHSANFEEKVHKLKSISYGRIGANMQLILTHILWIWILLSVHHNFLGSEGLQGTHIQRASGDGLSGAIDVGRKQYGPKQQMSCHSFCFL